MLPQADYIGPFGAAQGRLCAAKDAAQDDKSKKDVPKGRLPSSTPI